MSRSNRATQTWRRIGKMQPVIAHLCCSCFLFLLACGSVACRSASLSQSSLPRYAVTASPIDIRVGPGLCVAVDPLDREGVWWWEPGVSGCSSRATGPGVFHAEHAAVLQSARSGPVAFSFRLQTHSATRPFVDVRLVVEDGDMRAVETGARVPIRRRNDLDVTEVAVRGQRWTG